MVAAHVCCRVPVHLLRDEAAEAIRPFSFFGPTCDDLDHREGPFDLPANIDAGDYIESAGWAPMARRCAPRSTASATASITVTDEPMASQYLGDRREVRVSDNVVSLR